MDDSPVQTALCVIGHPIAGNPAQFCISRILQSLEMDWQCLSFDVPPESLKAAIDGIDVLHFAGALIAPPHQSAVSKIVLAQRLSRSAVGTPLPSPALPSPPLPQPDSAGLPTPVTPPSTLAQPQDTPTPAVQDLSEPSPWCDALARDADGGWEMCNFIGDTLLELIREHEDRIGQQFSTCVFLGDLATFESLMTPFRQCLPEAIYFLGETKLERWPHDQLSADSSAAVIPPETSPEPPSIMPANTMPASEPSADPTEDAPSDEPDQAPNAPDPLHRPLLLIRPQKAPATAKKSGLKPAANQAVVESLLEDLHPQSLVVHLAPPGVPWPVLRGPGDSSIARINPLDLEVGRIAAALRRWTGHNVDRDALAEAIEEYLEI